MRNGIKIALVIAGGLSVVGCNNPNETAGTVIGATAGGLIGSQFGSGTGQAAATAVGIVAGGLIGNRIGASIDEQARQRAREAEYQALQYGPAGSPVVWRSPDSNVYGEVVPGPAYQRAGADCRNYTHTIYIDGQPQVAQGTACRNPNGTWTPVG